MARLVRSQLKLGNVLPLLALFVALGGTSYAAVKVTRNAVSAGQIKTSGVASSEVKNGSLRKADLRSGPLGPIGPVGLGGPQGAKGAAGDMGGTGDTGNVHPVTVQTTLADADLADNTSQSYNAFCPDGMQGIGGGFRGDFEDSEGVRVGSSRPAISQSSTGPPLDNGAYTGWRITAFNIPGDAFVNGLRPEVWVICVPMS